jgi:hypothetical protein
MKRSKPPNTRRDHVAGIPGYAIANCGAIRHDPQT